MAITRFDSSSTGGRTPSTSDNRGGNTGNFGYTGDISQKYLSRVAIMNNEPQLMMQRFATLPEVRMGYDTQQFMRAKQVNESAFTETTVTEINNPSGSYSVGTTPGDTDVPIGLISIRPKQFVIVGTISDMIEAFSIPSYIEAAVAEYAKAAGRRMDKLVQDTVYTSASTNSRLSFKGTGVSSVNEYTSANTSTTQITLSDISRMNAILMGRHADGFAGLNNMYACIMHTNVLHDLRSSTATGGVLDIYKHTPEQVQKLVRGYVGDFYGVSVFASSFIQPKKSTGAGTPNVYPSFFLATGAVGCMKYMMSAYTVGFTASKSDPAAQRARVALKYVFNCIVLKHENLQVLLTQSSLG